MIRRIVLKIKEHDEDDAYEMYAMKIKKDVFVSFIMYDDEGLFPHCHIRIWKKDGENRKELYHIALRLDKPKFHHIEELGILDNKEYLKEIINLLEKDLDTISYKSTIWKFLVSTWNFTIRNWKVNQKWLKIPDYRKLLR